RATHAPRRPPHDRRAFIVRCVGHRPRWRSGHGFLPSPFELLAVPLRTVAIEEIPVGLNTPENEVLGRFPEDRLPLFRVSVQQSLAAPAAQARGQLPAEVSNIVEAIIEAVAAIGRMT